MKYFSGVSKLSDLKRLRFIVSVVFRAGGKPLLAQANLKYLVPLRCKIQYLFSPPNRKSCLVHVKRDEHVISPVALRKMFEALGPTFIKLGQVLSMRADIVGEEISSELSKLQSDVPPFSYDEVRKTIQEELGDSPEKLFRSFSKKPVAAASLAQVHKAVTKSGEKLAIKVQRPNVKQVIEQDIHILFFLARAIERFMPKWRIYQPSQVVKEFAQWTMRELDFRAEGHNADRFAAIFKKHPHVTTPRIHWDYTAQRVLAMDFMEGIKADDLDGMKKMSIDPKKVALAGVDALFTQFFIEGFFHADPHPGNFFVMKGDILCLHDSGMVGQLTLKQRQELLGCFISFVNQDIESYQRHFLHLASVNKLSDVDGFKRDISNLLSEFFYSPKRPSIALSFFNLVNSGVRHGISFPTDLVLFAKALITTEALGAALYPEFDFNSQFQPFVTKTYKAYLDPRKILKAVQSDVFDYVDFMTNLPHKIQDLFEKVESGNIEVKIDSSDLLGIKQEFERQSSVHILAIMLTAAIIFTGAVFSYEGEHVLFGLRLGTIGLLVTGFLLVWFIIKLRKGSG